MNGASGEARVGRGDAAPTCRRAASDPIQPTIGMPACMAHGKISAGAFDDCHRPHRSFEPRERALSRLIRA
eukprot:scaffold19161_cov112-Isochrysis_galbana.AAC.2